jgi:hypothetical protein
MPPPDIFKAYDIRDIVGKTLTPPIDHIGVARLDAAGERANELLA